MRLNRFLAQAFTGNSRGGAHLGAIGITWFAWLILGGIPLVLVGMIAAVGNANQFAAWAENPGDMSILGIPPVVTFIVITLSFVIGMIALWLGAKLVLRRGLASFVTGWAKIRWGRMMAAMGVWAAMLGAYTLIQYLIDPTMVIYAPDWGQFLIFLVPGIVLIPLQSAFEEMAIRGQLMQALGKVSPAQPWLPLLATSAIFAVLHIANPEVQAYGVGIMMLHLFTFGLVLGILALMDEGLELSIGVHVGNNLYLLLIASYPDSALQTPAPLHQMEIFPWLDYLALLGFFALFFLVFFRKKLNNVRAIWVNEPINPPFDVDEDAKVAANDQ